MFHETIESFGQLARLMSWSASSRACGPFGRLLLNTRGWVRPEPSVKINFLPWELDFVYIFNKSGFDLQLATRHGYGRFV